MQPNSEGLGLLLLAAFVPRKEMHSLPVLLGLIVLAPTTAASEFRHWSLVCRFLGTSLPIHFFNQPVGWFMSGVQDFTGSLGPRHRYFIRIDQAYLSEH